MEFDNSKPIYVQIGEGICERILSGDYPPGERIPSVREYGAQIGVNPNTVMRTYEKLTAEGILFNKRGIGYFVTPSAPEIIRGQARKAFLEREWPLVLRKIDLLGLDRGKLAAMLEAPVRES